MMLRVNCLTNDQTEAIDALHFSTIERPDAACHSMFMMTCTLDGSVNDGKVTGKWPQPSSGPFNSVLMWAPAVEYFADQANRILAPN